MEFNINTEVVNDGTFSEETSSSEGSAIAIIGGADGPTTVIVANLSAEPESAETSEVTEEIKTEETTFEEVKTEETTVANDSPLGNVMVEPENFVENLGYMGTGMAGIFVVIAIIIGATVLMNKIFSGKK